MKRGETAEQVAAAIGGAVSPSTVSRRMRELRGSVKAPRRVTNPAPAKAKAGAPVAQVVAVSDAPLPSSPEDIPEDASLPELAGLLERCKAALKEAEDAKNLPLVGQMIRCAASLAETIRKATPVKQADPNDAPDMVALRAEAARKWHEMVDLVADGEP